MKKGLLIVSVVVVLGLLLAAGLVGGAVLAQGRRSAPDAAIDRMGNLWRNAGALMERRGWGMMGRALQGTCDGTCEGHVDGEECDGNCAGGLGRGKSEGRVEGETCDGNCAGAEGRGLGRGLRRSGRTCDGTCDHSTEAK